MSGLPPGQAALGAAALEQAAQDVLGTAWGCSPYLSSEGTQLAALRHGTALPLSIEGQRHELQLRAEVGVASALLPRMLGRVATAEEASSLGEELIAELLNQVAGRLSGLLGEQGMHVDLGTPASLALAGSLSSGPGQVDGMSASLAAAPAAFAVTAWRCHGHRLVLSLSPVPPSHS